LLPLFHSLRRRKWIAIPLAFLLIWVFLVADFKAAYTRADLRSAPKSLVRNSVVGGPTALIQEIVVEVEGDDDLALTLDLALHRKFGALGDFADVRSPDLSGNRAFPLLRVRSKPQGLWLGLFAAGTFVVEYSYSTFSFDVEPGVDTSFLDIPVQPDQSAAVASGRIEHEVSAYGPISLPAWQAARVEPIAKQIVEEVVAAQRRVRRLK
jgi:hypothetical protein